MSQVRTIIWKEKYQLHWAQFRWQALSQQIRCRTLTFHRNQYKIHHWHQLNQSHRRVRRQFRMTLVFLAGIWAICTQQFVRFPIISSFNSKLLARDVIIIQSFLSLAPPSYAESEYRANIVDKNDSQHIRVAPGQSEFAPRYPTYTATALPPLPNFK